MVFILGNSGGRFKRYSLSGFRKNPDTLNCKFILIRPKPKNLFSNTRRFKIEQGDKDQHRKTGCIKYEDGCFSNKDIKYKLLETKLLLSQAEYTIQVPVRENFRSVPSGDTVSVHSGYVFINNIHPIILKDEQQGPVDQWRFVLLIRRSYKQNYFDAHISISCTPSIEAPPSATVFVKLEFQMLNHDMKVHRTLNADGIQPVSDRCPAKYDFSNIISLYDLQAPSNNLLKNGKTYFKIRLTYATGYQTVSLLNQQKFQIKEWLLQDCVENASTIKDICILTNGKVLTAHSQVLFFRCPLLASEIIDKCIHLETFSETSISYLLNLLYTGDIETFKVLKVLPELIQLCHIYNLPDLKQICFDIWSERLTIKNVAKAIVFAFVYGASKNVLLKIQEFIFRNGAAIKRIKSTKFFAKHFPLAFASLMFGPLQFTANTTQVTSNHHNNNYKSQSLNMFLNKTFTSSAKTN